MPNFFLNKKLFKYKRYQRVSRGELNDRKSTYFHTS